MSGAAARYEDLRELFERAVTVRYIAGFQLVTCRAEDDTADARSQMDRYGYDMLPVITDGAILGYVERAGLNDGPCAACERRLGPADLVSDSTPILDLFPILQHRPRVFVLQGNRVTGVVSRSDLQKAPVRMLVFTLVTLLEMHLQRLVSSLYPSAEWAAHLSGTRIRLAERLHAERRERNEQIELIDCLQFCDKRDLILRVSGAVSHLGFATHRRLDRFLTEAEEVRDLLAHGQDLVAGSSWPERIQLIMELQRVLQSLESATHGPLGEEAHWRK
jgi:predicted transcriptional regulator